MLSTIFTRNLLDSMKHKYLIKITFQIYFIFQLNTEQTILTEKLICYSVQVFLIGFNAVLPISQLVLIKLNSIQITKYCGSLR